MANQAGCQALERVAKQGTERWQQEVQQRTQPTHVSSSSFLEPRSYMAATHAWDMQLIGPVEAAAAAVETGILNVASGFGGIVH